MVLCLEKPGRATDLFQSEAFKMGFQSTLDNMVDNFEHSKTFIIMCSLLIVDRVRKALFFHASIPFPSISIDNSCNRLRVLPGAGFGAVASKSIEAQASIVEVDALKANENLEGAVLSRASNERTVGVGEDAEAVARADGPASLDRTFGLSGGVGLGVLDGTGVGVDVDLLATWDNHTHRKGVLAASESSGVAGGAAANVLDVVGAVGGGLLIEPDGVARGRDGLVVDGRGGAGRGEAEVLSGSSREEAGEGSEGEGGLHCEWWLWVGLVGIA